MGTVAVTDDTFETDSIELVKPDEKKIRYSS